MVKLIFKDFNRSWEELRQDTKLAIKLNAYFRKLGIKDVENANGREIRKTELLRKEITLLFSPNVYDLTYQVSLSGTIRDFFYDDLKVEEAPSVRKISKKLDKNQVDFTLGVNGDKLNIGCYLPDRNIIICSIPFRIPLFRKKEFLEWFMDFFGTSIKQCKVKKVSVEKKIEAMTIELFASSINQKIKDLDETVRLRSQDIKNYGENIVKYMRSNMIAKREMISLKIMKESTKKELSIKIREIKKLSFVETVELNTDGIIVNVGYVSMKYKGKNVILGRFRIIITPLEVTIENLDAIHNDSETFDHPHIERGHPCFGTRKNKVNELLARFALKELVYFVYLYLRSYNYKDCYMKMQKWVELRGDNPLEAKAAKLDQSDQIHFDGDEEGEDEDSDEDRDEYYDE